MTSRPSASRLMPSHCVWRDHAASSRSIVAATSATCSSRRPGEAGVDLGVARRHAARVALDDFAALRRVEHAHHAVGVAGEVREHVPDRPSRQQARRRRRPGRAARACRSGRGATPAAPARWRCERSLDHGPHATCQACRHAAGDDRPGTDGRQHGPPARAGGPRVRRLRHRRRRGQHARRRGHDRRPVAHRPRRAARPPAARVDHGARRVRRLDDRRPGAAPGAGRRDHRRWQLVVPRRHPPVGSARRRPRHRVRRRGHERRDARPGARLLPDDRRPRRGGRAADADLRHPGPGRRHRRAHARTAAHRRRRRRRPSGAGCTAGRPAPGTSSRWSTTASSTG